MGKVKDLREIKGPKLGATKRQKISDMGTLLVQCKKSKTIKIFLTIKIFHPDH